MAIPRPPKPLPTITISVSVTVLEPSNAVLSESSVVPAASSVIPLAAGPREADGATSPRSGARSTPSLRRRHGGDAGDTDASLGRFAATSLTVPGRMMIHSPSASPMRERQAWRSAAVLWVLFFLICIGLGFASVRRYTPWRTGMVDVYLYAAFV